ncbi:MAG: DeoR/GlpR family DNA-binding transcription regulator, partial [Candidatus Acidiferrales bacterium]
RIDTILSLLRLSGNISVEMLSKKLKVSVVTVRRDLDLLEQKNLLRRKHGGAVSIEPLFYEPFKNDHSFQSHIGRFSDEKKRIGRAAAALIGRGETIGLTPGTTTSEVIRGLPLDHDITVVTNTVNIAMELCRRKDLKVFVTGGHLRGDWFSLVGPTAVQSLQQVLIDTLFIGADGLDAKWGATCLSPDEATLNAAMVRQARRKIAVVDHSKLGKRASWQICNTQEIDMLITDAKATDKAVDPFRSVGIKVLTV